MDEFPFNDDDVMSIDHDGSGTKLLKLAWFRDIIKRHLDPIASQWFGKGIECQVLSTNGGGWQKGRVRLRLEYIPDESPE